MSEELEMAGRIDEMRKRYDEFNQGDIQGATQDWADDIVWQGSNSTQLPGGGEHRGKDEVLNVLQQAVGAWDEFKLSPDEFFEDGDTVVVLGHTDVKKGDQSAQTPVVHIWRWQGDQIKRLQILTDTLQVAQLLGAA
jgi:ketosteroid isomerase-like protein